MIYLPLIFVTIIEVESIVVNLRLIFMTYIKQSLFNIFCLLFFVNSGIGEVMATEQAKYKVVNNDDSFQVRLYEPHIVAETIVDSQFEDAGSKTFKRLFKYISGNNRSQQNIEMTSPVTQEAGSEKIEMTSPVGQRDDNGRWAVSFTMPASYSYDTLPEPKDPKIVLRRVSQQFIASIEYSGFWSKKSYLSNKDKLQDWINENSYNITGKAVWARYNAPFTPWFLRRNEILIPIKNPATEAAIHKVSVNH